MSEEITHTTIIQWMINGFIALFGIMVSLFAGVVGYVTTQLSGHTTRILDQTEKIAEQASTLSAIRQKADDLSTTIYRIHSEDLAWKSEINRRLDAIENRAERAVKVADEIVRKHQINAEGHDS
jgi:hypothetical protein